MRFYMFWNSHILETMCIFLCMCVWFCVCDSLLSCMHTLSKVCFFMRLSSVCDFFLWCTHTLSDARVFLCVFVRQRLCLSLLMHSIFWCTFVFICTCVDVWVFVCGTMCVSEFPEGEEKNFADQTFLTPWHSITDVIFFLDDIPLGSVCAHLVKLKLSSTLNMHVSFSFCSAFTLRLQQVWKYPAAGSLAYILRISTAWENRTKTTTGEQPRCQRVT